MQKHLYFICPTDHIERIINKTFQQENYFYTSLGNSIRFDADMAAQINGLIESKNITEVTFVLSSSNQVVMDVLSQQNFSSIEGLDSFYHEITQQKERSKMLWQRSDLPIPILSHYLNQKIKELQPKISSWIVDNVHINSKIYIRKSNVFKDVYADFFCEKYVNLN